MAMSYFESAIDQLYQMGVLDVLLPFILIFTIVFAVLQRTKVLGEKDGKPMKNFNVTIALVLALAAIIPHVLWGTKSPTRTCSLSNGFIDVVCTINNALPNISLIVVAVLMFLIVIGIWGKNVDIGGTTLGGIVTVVSIIAVVAIFALSAGWMGNLPNWLGWLRDSETQALVVVIIVFGLIIRFIAGPSDDKKPEDKNMFEKLSDVLKPIGK